MRPGRFYAAVLLLTLATLKERFPPEALARDLSCFCSRLLERAPGWRLRGEPRPEPEAWPAMLSAPTPPR